MRNLLFVLFLIFIASPAVAEHGHLDKIFILERTDGGISIITFDNSPKFMLPGETEEDYITREMEVYRRKMQDPGSRYFNAVEREGLLSNIPTEDGSDMTRDRREQWKFKNGRLKIDMTAPSPEKNWRDRVNALSAKVKSDTASAEERMELIELKQRTR